MHQSKIIALTALSAILVTVAIVYLTPLKWINLVEPTINDVAPSDFYAEYVKNPDGYIFLDVRSESAYERLHAEGSISMPLHTLYNERVNLPKKGKKIILICSGGVASGVAYHYLQHHGFFNIYRIEGGIEEWVISDLPTDGSSLQIPEVSS